MSAQVPFEIKPFADVGTKEPFVARTSLGLIDILQAIDLPNKQAISEEIITMLSGSLMPAFLSLRELRKCVDKSDVPVVTKAKHFDDFYRHLWAAYKDRMQKVARLMGFDVGFIFKNDSSFEKEAAQFQSDHPKVHHSFAARLAQDRNLWQTSLSRFRNEFLEHQSLQRESVAGFYELEKAEIAFDNVWMAIEDIIVDLAASMLPPFFQIVEIPEQNRDPACPKRFGFAFVNPPTQ